MTSLLRPTLGPVPRTVAIERIVNSREPPEVLDTAALIARRTIQLADPFEDMGAMIIRHLVWRVFQAVGDGGATAAVLADALARSANTYLVAGYAAVGVRRGAEQALELALSELRSMARTADSPAELAALVGGTLRDPELAEMIGEVMDTVGADGAVLVENAQGTHTSHEYVDGVRWNEGYLSPFLLGQPNETMPRLVNPRILVTDYTIERAEELLPALEVAVSAGERRLCVIAPDVRDAAIGLLHVNRERGVLEGAMAVRAPSIGTQRLRILEDLAVITGGRCISQDRHHRLTDVTLQDLGTARQVWATHAAFGILGGGGARAALRQRIAEAKAELSQTDLGDVGTRDRIRERIGKLAGTTAIVQVGAPTTTEQEDLKLRVEAAVRAARAAIQEGVVPGGGAALTACGAAVERAARTHADTAECVGARALAAALSAPLCAIAENAGYESAPLLHAARHSGPECVFDVLSGAWVDAFGSGILDPLSVVSTALQTAVSAAASVTSADVLVHRKAPPQSFEP